MEMLLPAVSGNCSSGTLHPLPFLAALLLLFTARWQPLSAVQWLILGIYVLYLLPYIGIGYYDRYGVPLLGTKALLTFWGLDRLVSLWSWKRTNGTRAKHVLQGDVSARVVQRPEPAGSPTC